MPVIQEEQKLVHAAQNNDQKALVTLYEKYLPAIYRFLYSQTGNQQDAEDLAQDTLTDAFAKIKQFQGRASFKNWLYQISKYKLADWWREKYKKPTVPLEDFYTLGEKPNIFFDDETDMQEIKQKEDTIKKILESLPEHYRRVLEFRFLKNYTLKETAAELNKTEGNIKVIQFRALKKASIIAEEYESIYE